MKLTTDSDVLYIEDNPENFAGKGDRGVFMCNHGELLKALEPGGPVECDGLIYEVVIVDVVKMEKADA